MAPAIEDPTPVVDEFAPNGGAHTQQIHGTTQLTSQQAKALYTAKKASDTFVGAADEFEVETDNFIVLAKHVFENFDTLRISVDAVLKELESHKNVDPWIAIEKFNRSARNYNGAIDDARIHLKPLKSVHNGKFFTELPSLTIQELEDIVDKAHDRGDVQFIRARTILYNLGVDTSDFHWWVGGARRISDGKEIHGRGLHAEHFDPSPERLKRQLRIAVGLAPKKIHFEEVKFAWPGYDTV